MFETLNHNKLFFVFKNIVFLMVGCMIVGCCGCGRQEQIRWSHEEEQVSYTERISQSDQETAPDEQIEKDQTEMLKESTPEVTQDTSIYVYVCGAVTNPGVYELRSGSRVYQLIEAAGGFTRDAAINCINQASVVEDGQMIQVYTEDEYQPDIAQLQADGAQIQGASENDQKVNDQKVNINTADLSQLMTLPGIGETKAQAIISYRESQGLFQTIDEIMCVEGIKDGVYTRIKDRITV